MSTASAPNHIAREVVLVRHGEAVSSVHGLVASAACLGLTSYGHQQTRRLVRRLVQQQRDDCPITELYASPTLRARQTAEPIAEALGISAEIVDDLRVPDPGPVDGQPWDVVRRQFPPDVSWLSRPAIPGGESWQDYTRRAHACLADILNGHPGGQVVIVGHHETLTATMTLLLGVPNLGALAFDMGHTGVTRLRAVNERRGMAAARQRWALLCHNDLSHVHSGPSDPGVVC